MNRRFLVIGLGQFGASVARGLARRDMDVTVIDRSEQQVEQITGEVNRALVGDATDQRTLEELEVDRFHVAIIALGPDSLEGSILCTALLRQLGVRTIIARSTSKIHERILLSLKVDRVVEPESFMGERLAQQLASPGLINQMDMGEGAMLVEVEVSERWVGRSLIDLDLRRRFGVTVVALRRETSAAKKVLIASPRPDIPLERKDVAVVLGVTEEVERFLKEIG